jgi:acyl-CoA thioesterase FadM
MTGDTNTIGFPLRWSDLDLVQHVNNVRYLDFSRAALVSQVENGLDFDPRHVSHCSVSYRAPVTREAKSISVSTAITDRSAEQELTTSHLGTTSLAASVSTRWVPRSAQAHSSQDSLVAVDVFPRRDEDDNGLIDYVTQFAYFQEGRVAFLDLLRTIAPGGQFAVAQVAAEFHQPLPWRSAPYVVRIWLQDFGNSSMVTQGDIREDGIVYATMRSVQVAFEQPTQRSRRLNVDERAFLHLHKTGGHRPTKS